MPIKASSQCVQLASVVHRLLSQEEGTVRCEYLPARWYWCNSNLAWNVGDVIVTQASVRFRWRELALCTYGVPAVANFECTTAMVAACRDAGVEATLA